MSYQHPFYDEIGAGPPSSGDEEGEFQSPSQEQAPWAQGHLQQAIAAGIRQRWAERGELEGRRTPSGPLSGPLPPQATREEDIDRIMTELQIPPAARPLGQRSLSNAIRERRQQHLGGEAARPTTPINPPRSARSASQQSQNPSPGQGPISQQVQQRGEGYRSEVAQLRRQLRFNDRQRAAEFEHVNFVLRRIEEQQRNQMRVQERLMDAFASLDLQEREAARAAAMNHASQELADQLRSGNENERPLPAAQPQPPSAAQHAFSVNPGPATWAPRTGALSQPQPDASVSENTNTDRTRQDSGARSSMSLPSRKSSKLGSIDETVHAAATADAQYPKIFAQGTVFAGREELDDCLRAEGLRYYKVLDQGASRGLVVQHEHNTIRKGLPAVFEDKSSYQALPPQARAYLATERPEEYLYVPGTGMLTTWRGARVNSFYFDDDFSDDDDDAGLAIPKKGTAHRHQHQQPNPSQSRANPADVVFHPQLGGGPSKIYRVPQNGELEPSPHAGVQFRQSQPQPPATPGYVDPETGIDTGMLKEVYEQYLRNKAEDDSDA
ncbi:hypothetical protein Slin15195_G097490 [Septoria linicola]|uniref:Uncharacterized protein n=1 Tax=Septoria linicola TaxID=215465 RepID=A0A9Q9EMV4_9PEZI|nr:hypothetical protein Slin15195_G097490 [Septoria linicola]